MSTPSLRPSKFKESPLKNKRCKSESEDIGSQKENVAANLAEESITDKYNCQTCKDVFKNQALLKRHELMHQQLGKIECEVCFKLFKDRNELKLHTQTHKSGKKNWCVSPFKRPKGGIPASNGMKKACVEFRIAYEKHFNSK